MRSPPCFNHFRAIVYGLDDPQVDVDARGFMVVDYLEYILVSTVRLSRVRYSVIGLQSALAKG